MSNIVKCSLVVLVFCFSDGLCKKAPAYIHPCTEVTDDCITKAVQAAIPEFVKGIPELGVQPLDPFEIETIAMELAGGLKITLHNGVFTGFRKCLIEKASLVGTAFSIDLRCNSTIKGKYTANGRILVFPINGNGDAKIKVVNMKVHVSMNTVNKIDEDGKYHIHFKNYKTTHAWGDRVIFHLTNLFEGNPEISKTVLQFMNENWRQVAEEFGGPIVDAAVERVIENIKNFFKAVPYEELLYSPVIVE